VRKKRPLLELLKKVERLIETGASAEDWTFAPIADAPLDGFPEVPLVVSGTGGTWVPVYIHVPKTRSRSQSRARRKRS